jgi:prepilin-type N-terminal cleavage/methylation domain-containing protein
MVHGSNMTRGHRGMRKGLSLMEMLVAIVLLGLIGTIGYNYYKNYYDTSFAAKQARIYVIVDQATQIRNAWDLYNTKNGADPVAFADFISDRILTEVPVAMPLISATGWQVASPTSTDLFGTIDLDSSLLTDYAIVMEIDGSASVADKTDYCNIVNNTADTTWSLDPTVSTLAAQPNDAAGGYTQNPYFYCFDNTGADDGTGLVIGFTYRVDPN